jgi:hypothetical protein
MTTIREFISSALSEFSGVALQDLDRTPDGKVKYRGKKLKPNQPVASDRPGKKRMVLATKKVGGETKVKLVHYGAKGYSHNYNPEAKRSYLARSGGIRDKHGKLTSKDKWSPNHWARKDLWSKNLKADGSTKYSLKPAHTKD